MADSSEILRAIKQLYVDGGDASGIAVEIGSGGKYYDSLDRWLCKDVKALGIARCEIGYVDFNLAAALGGVMSGQIDMSLSGITGGTDDYVIVDAFGYTTVTWSDGGGPLSSVVFDLGHAMGGGDDNAYIAGTDNALTSGAYYYIADGQKGVDLQDQQTALLQGVTGTLKIKITADVNLNTLTAGKTNIIVWYYEVPGSLKT